MKKYNITLLILVGISAFAMDAPESSGSGAEMGSRLVRKVILGDSIFRSLIKHASVTQSVLVHMPTARMIVDDLKKAKEEHQANRLTKKFRSKLPKKTKSKELHAQLLQPIKVCESARHAVQQDTSYLSKLPEEIFVGIEHLVLNNKSWQLMSPKQVLMLFLKPFKQEFIDGYCQKAPVYEAKTEDLKDFLDSFVLLNDQCFIGAQAYNGSTFLIPNITISSKGVIRAEERADDIYNLAESCGYRTKRNRENH